MEQSKTPASGFDDDFTEWTIPVRSVRPSAARKSPPTLKDSAEEFSFLEEAPRLLPAKTVVLASIPDHVEVVVTPQTQPVASKPRIRTLPFKVSLRRIVFAVVLVTVLIACALVVSRHRPAMHRTVQAPLALSLPQASLPDPVSLKLLSLPQPPSTMALQQVSALPAPPTPSVHVAPVAKDKGVCLIRISDEKTKSK